jgi:hypothetical protein
MTDFIWWVGLVHIMAYAFIGTFAVIALLVVKAHMLAKVMSRIIQWHYARAVWRDKTAKGFDLPEPRP